MPDLPKDFDRAAHDARLSDALAVLKECSPEPEEEADRHEAEMRDGELSNDIEHMRRTTREAARHAAFLDHMMSLMGLAQQAAVQHDEGLSRWCAAEISRRAKEEFIRIDSQRIDPMRQNPKPRLEGGR